ncbi:MAG: TIGR02281 family clan AA aspartic protease [Betaproteobacteria bacterium]|nr:TIGR02281 family clan AA aspartic protease [Betaproteobacteria bacterium]
MLPLRGVGRGVYLALLSLWLLGAAPPLAAQDVGLAGIVGSKAMLIVNGGQPEALRVGESLGGVKLLAIQDEQVIVEIGGRKRPLRVGQHAVGASAADGSGKIVLTADARGHFYTTGTVNGTSLRFIVDTGASMISLGASDARRLGLDFNRGQKGYAQTANGQAEVSKIKLDSVSIGGVTLHQVDALINRADMPYALLGMSFLNRMEMQRDGQTMTLRQRF